MISDNTRREWAVRVASQPRMALVNHIMKLGKDRDFARGEAKGWKDVALGRRKFGPGEFEAHLADGNEVES